MNKILFATTLSVSLGLTACGGSNTVTRTSAKAPDQIRTVAFSRQDGNSAEVTGYLTNALIAQGLTPKNTTSSQSFKSSEADAIISYLDVWRWDVVTYLKSMTINLYNANTGELLVSGRWSDSLLHSYNRGEMVSQALIKEMFSRLDLKQDSAPVSSAELPANPPLVQPPAAKPSATKSNNKANARHEYTAREQARALQCRVQEILGVEGAGTPREEITFDCGDGRKMTIVCHSDMGCS